MKTLKGWWEEEGRSATDESWQLKACQSYYQESIAGGGFHLRIYIIFQKFSQVSPRAGALGVLARGPEDQEKETHL